jgi:hypothetical protein
MIKIPKTRRNKMMKKFSRKISVAVILLMLLTVSISSPLIYAMQSSAETKSSPYNGRATSHKSSNWGPRNLTESYTNRYLELFGINKNNSVKETEIYEKEEKAYGDIITDFSKSSKYTLKTAEGPKTVSMNDALSLNPDKTSNSYQYTADLSIANSEKYKIFETQSKTTLKSQTTIETHQKIDGTINYSMDSTETKKRIGNLIEKQNTVSVEYTNSSGSFYLNIAGTSTWNEKETAILDGTFTVDQNLHKPLGKYTFQFTQLENASGTKILVTIPNGTIIDPILLECDDEVQEYGQGPGYYYVLHLKSYYVYWTLLEEVTAMLISQALADLLQALFAPVGIVYQILELVIDAIIHFCYTASNDQLYSYYTAINWELWQFEPNYQFWYMVNSGPHMGETGYRTDIFYGIIYMHYWVFFPVGWAGRYAHTSAWPTTSGDEFVTPFHITDTSYSVYGSGSVTADDNLCGLDDDSSARILATGDIGDGANIVGQMNSYSYGTIELRLNVSSPVRIYVYTANNFGGPWTLRAQNDIGITSSIWLRCGGYVGGFNYIAIACVKYTGASADVYLDSVRVTHPPSPLSS